MSQLLSRLQPFLGDSNQDVLFLDIQAAPNNGAQAYNQSFTSGIPIPSQHQNLQLIFNSLHPKPSHQGPNGAKLKTSKALPTAQLSNHFPQKLSHLLDCPAIKPKPNTAKLAKAND
ncbi:MAG: hypothetical protein FRX48_06059 [Lasallia pustulata]|uniref:Uncharacterized protein n=1 Tax=Lasallia pustulata TaxID=136370 RepID=A0A5M8PNZ2_9LECA|nr:MAG: hypothetical protein FRX48_06059 [Lasallia pustulata]